MPLAAADEWAGDDAPDVVLPAHELARNGTDAPQLIHWNDVLVRSHLEDGIGGRVDDRTSGANVFFAELVEDHGPRGGFVAKGLAADAALKFGDDIGREAVRIRTERILDDEPHHFPVTRGRVLPRADFRHTPERRARRLAGCGLRQ